MKLNQQHQDLLKATSEVSKSEMQIKSLSQDKSRLEDEKVLLESSCVQLEADLHQTHAAFQDASNASLAACERVNWMMQFGIQGIFKRVWNEPKFGDAIAKIGSASMKSGLQLGFNEGFYHHTAKKKLEEGAYYNKPTEAEMQEAQEEFVALSFEVFDLVGEFLKTDDPVGEICAYFEESGWLGAEIEEKAWKKEEERQAAMAHRAGGSSSAGVGGGTHEVVPHTDDIDQYIDVTDYN